MISRKTLVLRIFLPQHHTTVQFTKTTTQNKKNILLEALSKSRKLNLSFTSIWIGRTIPTWQKKLNQNRCRYWRDKAKRIHSDGKSISTRIFNSFQTCFRSSHANFPSKIQKRFSLNFVNVLTSKAYF